MDRTGKYSLIRKGLEDLEALDNLLQDLRDISERLSRLEEKVRKSEGSDN